MGVNLLLFQASEGRRKASKELQTRAFPHRARVALLTRFALALAHLKKEKK